MLDWNGHRKGPGHFWPALAVMREVTRMKSRRLLGFVVLTWLALTLVVPGTALAADNTLKWKFSTGPAGSLDSSPALGPDGTVYISGANNYLYAVTAPTSGTTGVLKWKYPIGGSTTSSPAVGKDGTIYVGAFDHKLYAVTAPATGANGVLKWSYLTDAVINSSPAIAPDGTIYVGTDNGSVYALTPGASSATLKWKYVIPGEINPAIASSPAIGRDGTIYVGAGLYLYALDPNPPTTDGLLKWQYGTITTVTSSPAVGTDGTIYVGSVNMIGSGDNYLHAVNPANGTSKWATPYATQFGVNSSPAIGSDGTIYLGDNSGRLYAVNPDGTSKWPLPYGGLWNFYSSPAIGADGTIYIGSTDTITHNNLHAVNPNGTGKWTFPTTDGIYWSSPAIGGDGTVYIGSRDGFLYAVNTTCGGLAQSPWPMFHHDMKHTGKAPAASLAPLSLFLMEEEG